MSNMSTAPDGSPLIIGLNGSLIAEDSCTISTCSLLYAEVEYIPSFSANLAYLIILATLLLAQIVLGLLGRTWTFLTGITCGLILEVIGYAGRLGLHNDPFSFNAFLIYLICLTIGPAFLTASIYVCLSRLIIYHGAELARFKPKTYTRTFICCDVISLILQAAGGAIAATANPGSAEQTGVNVMIAGLAFQVVSLALFMVLSLDFVRRVRKAGPKNGPSAFYDMRQRTLYRLFPYALALATVTIFIRSAYRVAELQSGFGGSLANNQTIFLIFEGPMIIIAMCALTMLHPGHVFGDAYKVLKNSAVPGEEGWELQRGCEE